MADVIIERLEEVLSTDLEMLTFERDDYKEILHEATEVADRLIELRKIEVDRVDKEERRKMDEEKSKEAIALETMKAKKDWRTFALEWGKVLLPLALQAIAYGIYQARAIHFEETGTMRSWASKEMHLPKFWK